jgi:hypothetical protein
MAQREKDGRRHGTADKVGKWVGCHLDSDFTVRPAFETVDCSVG